MAVYKLTGKYETLIDRLSQQLSAFEGRRVSKTEVVQRILDVVIQEENLFSTKEQAVGFFNRTIFRIEDKPRSDKSIAELIDAISAVNKSH